MGSIEGRRKQLAEEGRMQSEERDGRMEIAIFWKSSGCLVIRVSSNFDNNFFFLLRRTKYKKKINIVSKTKHSKERLKKKILHTRDTESLDICRS